MKKKALLLAVMLPLIMAMLFSCKLFSKNKDNGGGKDKDESSENLLFKDGFAPDIVYYSDSDAEMALELCLTLTESTGFVPNFYKGVPKDATKPTIYLGPLDNELSRKAYEKLDRLVEDAYYDDDERLVHVGYVVYSDGKSLAIAYSDDLYGSTKQEAVRFFLDNYVIDKDELAVKSGSLLEEVYRLQDFLEAVDEEYYTEAWAKLLEQTGNAELVEALKHLKGLYTDNVIAWLANLYDEEIGGFYYSNSGRDNVGFLPDVDSTYQAIVLVRHMGMMSDFGYGNGSFPAGFWQQVGLFAKSLQHENGFFYHPQWTKELVDSKLTRRARDLIRAQSLIRSAGMSPTYDTPDGGKGDGLVWDKEAGVFVPVESLTGPIAASGSIVTAVSKVVPTATAIPDNLVSEEALRAYLDKFIANGTNFYTVNNELANQTSQFKYRDQQLKEEGASWRVATIVIDFLNEHQNPENGSWSTITNYNAVDGLFKAAHVYTDLGYQIPYAKEAAMTALNAITSEQATTHICNIYNCWCTLDMVMNNMKKFGAPDEAKAVLEEVRKVAAPSIEATMVKYLEFQKSDGSFSYYKDRCSAESQGMQLAIQCNEGDMNATSLTYSVWGTIFSVLDLEKYEIPLHSSTDFARFIEILDGIGGVIKDPVEPAKPITFDSDTVGAKSDDVTYNLISPNSDLTVIKDPRPGAKGNVLEMKSYPGGGDAVYFKANTLTLGTCFIFEGDFAVTDAKNGYVAQINLGPSGYMLNLQLVNSTDENGNPCKRVKILESSSQGSPRIERDLGVSALLGEWFNVRLEYYIGSHDSVRIKVFFNDELIAVSDNYYDHQGKKITNGTGAPNKYYSYTQINVMSDQQAIILMDNVFVDKTDKTYEPAHDLNDQPLINIDPPDRDEVIYDFDSLANGKNYPADFTVTENGGKIEVAPAESGKQLNISASGTAAKLHLPAVIRTRGTNCGVAEMKVRVNSGNVGSALSVTLRADNKISGDTGAITAVNLEIIERDGKKYVAVTEAPGGKTVSLIEGSLTEIGETFTLRLEYYEDAKALLIYVNGNLAASSEKLATGGGARSYGRLEISTADKSTIDVSIDDVKAERIVKSFSEATKPQKDSVIHDFEGTLGEGVTIPEDSIVKDVGDNAVKLDAAGEAIILPVNVRAVITSFTGLSATVNAKSAGTAIRIEFITENGGAAVALDVVKSGEKFYIYEYTESGRAAKPIGSFEAEGEFTLIAEYYPARRAMQITVDKTCVAVTSVTYSAENAMLTVKGINITSLSGSVTLDDCVAESYNKAYAEKTPATTNDENGAEKLTFESSSTGSLPSAITTELLSIGAAARIEQMLDKMNAASKVLSFSSTSDTGGDYVALGVTREDEGYNAIILEADLAFDREDGKALGYQIFFEDAKGSSASRLYLTSIDFNITSNCFFIKDYSSGSSSTTVQVDGQDAKLYRNDGAQVKYAPEGGFKEWFTLRIEIYEGARNEMRIKIYVNDTLLYVTNNFYNSHASDDHAPLDLVKRARILALSNCEATMYIDNASLVKTVKACEEDPENVASKFFPTTNKPVIIVPDTPVDPDEKIPEILDFEDGKINSNIKVEDKNGTNWPTLEAEDGRLSFSSDGGDYIYIRPTVTKGSYTYAMFEADMSFIFDVDAAANNRTFYTFTVCGENGSNFPTTYRFYIEYAPKTGVLRFAPRNGENAYGTVFSKTVGTAGDPTVETASLKLRIEYYIIGEDVVIVISIDGDIFSIVYSGENQTYKNVSGTEVSHNMYYTYKSDGTGKPLTSMGRIELNSHSGTKSTIFFDNVTFVQKNAELDKALIEAKPGTLIKGEYGKGDYHKELGGYEFNVTKIWNEIDLNNPNASGTPFLWRSTGGTNDARYITADGKSSAAGTLYSYIGIASYGTNKQLEYGQPHSDVRASRLYIKSTNTTGNLYVFETDLVIGSAEGLNAGDTLLSFHLRSGKTETSDFFGNLRVILNADGTYSIGYNADKIFATVKTGEWNNLRLEYYPEEGIARYYLNNNHIGSERIVTSLDTSVYAFASVSLAGAAYDAFVWLDNTVVTALDREFTPIEGEVDELATVLPVKGGANGVVVLIHDDGDLATMSILDRIYSKYGLNADVAMVVNRVYDTQAGAPKQANVEAWAPYINTDRWGLINHSLTHTFWGTADESALSVDEELLYEEIVKSGMYLRECFSNERVLTFAYPGFSAITDTLGYGKPKTYAAAMELIAKNYISGREYNFPTSNHTGLNLYDLNYGFLGASSISLGESNLNRVLERIDGAALGKLTVLFSHKVVPNGEEKASDSSTVPESYIETIAKHIGEYTENGVLWSAHYEDAMLYLREAEAARASSVKSGDTITVTLTDNLDDSVYNYALTVEVLVPETWVGAKIVQNGKTTYAKAFERDGKWMIYADITPDAGVATITSENNSSLLPSIPLLPCDHIDADVDGVCDVCEREYYDPETCKHRDSDGDSLCDKCESVYHDPATCTHKDGDGNGVCDKCESEYYDPETCTHTDRDGDGYCDKCHTPHYDYDTCPHVDSNGDAVCDRCGGFYSDPATCKHKDRDGDSLCDKCENEYHDPTTCTHKDDDGDEICDKCLKNLKLPEGGDLGGTGDDEDAWT